MDIKTGRQKAQQIHADVLPIFERDGRDNLEHQFAEVRAVVERHLADTDIGKNAIEYLIWDIASDFVGNCIQPQHIFNVMGSKGEPDAS